MSRKPKPQADLDKPIDIKRELFCYHLIAGLSPEEAYEAVGFAPDRSNCYSYYRNSTVQSRLSALRAEIEKRILRQDEEIWGKEGVAKFLQANAIESRAQGDYAPSNRAVELLGRDLGMFGTGSDAMLEVITEETEQEQALMAAAWLDEMREKHQVTTLEELSALLRGDRLSITGIIDSIEEAPALEEGEGVEAPAALEAEE